MRHHADASDSRPLSLPRLLTEEQVAAYLQVSPRTLQGWRLRGGGPPYLKIAGNVRYEATALDQYLDGQRRRSTCDLGRIGV